MLKWKVYVWKTITLFDKIHALIRAPMVLVPIDNLLELNVNYFVAKMNLNEDESMIPSTQCVVMTAAKTRSNPLWTELSILPQTKVILWENCSRAGPGVIGAKH